MKIRRFVLGKDEADWVKVRNAVYRRHPTFALITVEDLRKGEKDPEWDSKGRFIVEVNNNPVGLVHAHVDKFRKEKKGFVWTFGVVPEFRGQGIEEKLADTAMRLGVSSWGKTRLIGSRCEMRFTADTQPLR